MHRSDTSSGGAVWSKLQPPPREGASASKWEMKMGNLTPLKPQSSAAHAALEAQARKTARIMIKERAQAYLDNPWQLNMLKSGFDASLYMPEQLIEFAKAVLREESDGLFVFVPVRKINAQAAIVAGRYRRAKKHIRTVEQVA